MLVPLPTTDVSLVDLNRIASDRPPLLVAAEVKPLRNAEGSAMSDTKKARQDQARYTLGILAEQVEGLGSSPKGPL